MRATFTPMRDGTPREYALINARETVYNQSLYQRVLGAVRALDAAVEEVFSREPTFR